MSDAVRLATTALSILLAINIAHAQETDFDLPSQPLAESLKAVALQTKLNVLVKPSLVDGREAPILHSALTAQQALSHLLEGTDLEYQFVNDKTVVIREKGGKASIGTGSPAPTSSHDEASEPIAYHEGQSNRYRLAQAGVIDRSKQGGSAVRQVEAAESASNADELEEVVVTGTNIRGSQPVGSKVIVIDREMIERSGYGRIQDVLSTLTQNFNAVNETQVADDAYNHSRGAEVQLRGLGTGTTLTLVNGQRQAMGGQRGAFVNIASIPASAIERIEILPEGASAIYGSDAIGGVVNILLRKDYDGLETRVRASTADGEASETQFAQLFGATWSHARVLVGYDYYERDRLGASERDYSAANDDLRAFGGSDFRQFMSNPGTIISRMTGQPTAAIPAGQDGTNLTPAQLIPGAVNYFDNVTCSSIVPRIQTNSVFLNASVDISDAWEVFVEGRYGDRDMENVYPLGGGNITVPVTNAFNRMGGPVIVAYDFTDDLGPSYQSGTTETYSGTAGVSGQLGEAWQIKVAAAYARERDIWRAQNVLGSTWTTYLASSNPAIALNVFGDGSHTNPATLDAIRSHNEWKGDWATTSINAIANGPIFSTPAGDVKLAIGGDHRKEDYTQVAFSGSLNRTDARDLERNVTAFFGELAVPLLGANDRVQRNRLELSLAGRYEDYDDFGTTFDPKIGVSWRPWNFAILRGTWGTSFRAPPFNLSSPQFSASRASARFVTDPRSTAPNGQSQILLLSGNNPDLKEETGDVWTAGVDLTVPSVEGLTVSLTYFDIDYTDKIINPGPFSTMLVEEAKWREAITRDPTPAQVTDVCTSPGFTGACTGPFAAILDTRTRNLAGLQVRGVDAEIAQRLETGVGQWSFGLRGTYMLDYQTRLTDSAPAFEVVDTLDNPLALRLSAFVGWQLDRWRVQATVNHAGSYKNTGTIPVSTIDAWTTLDLNVGYDLQIGWLSNTRLSLSAINVFNTDAPFVNRADSFAYDPSNASLLGRQLSVQAIVTW